MCSYYLFLSLCTDRHWQPNCFFAWKMSFEWIWRFARFSKTKIKKQQQSIYVCCLFFVFYYLFIFYHSYNLCSNLSYDQIVETVAGNAWCRWLPISANPSPSTNRTCFSETMILNHPLNKMAQQQQFREKKGHECLSVFELLLNCTVAETH